MAVEAYIRFVAGGSKTPWQCNLAPKAGQDNTKLFIGCFASVKDCEVEVEKRKGRRLHWVLTPNAENIPLYVGTSP